MGRTDTFGQGGGFLNNVDVTFLGATFQPNFPGKAVDPAKPELYIVIRVQEDGKPAPVEMTLNGGAATGVTFAEDGKSVSTDDGRPIRLWNVASAFRFFESLEALLDDSQIYADTDLDTLDVTPLEGRRMRFAQEKDPGATTKQKGKKKDPKTGKFPEYDRKRPIVTRVYDAADGGAQARPTQAAVASKTTTSPTSKGKVAPPSGPDPDAVAILDAVLSTGKGGTTLEKRALGMAVTNHMLALGRKDHAAVAATIKDVAFLQAYGALGGGRAYDDSGKAPLVSFEQ